MIGYTKGYVLRNVTGKTKGIQVFLDDVNKFDLRAKSETDVKEHLDRGNFIIACYQKDKLRGYYFFETKETDCTGLKGYSGSGTEKCAVLTERFLGTGIPNDAVRAIDEEIQGSFLEDIVAGRFKGMVFDDRYITVDRGPLTKSALSSVLFGVLIGAVVFFVTRNAWLSFLVAAAWALAFAFLGVFAEINKQKETLHTENAE